MFSIFSLQKKKKNCR